jgi:hypothetical protein
VSHGDLDTSGAIGVFDNLGRGKFGTPVAVGDLNRDGSPDAVTANSAGSSVSVLLNYGDGTGYLQSKHDYGTTSTPTSVAIGDLNGDGAPELAVAESSVFLNDGAAASAHRTTTPPAPVRAQSRSAISTATARPTSSSRTRRTPRCRRS